MRILFLQKRLLYPSNTGGKIRTLNIVRHIAQWHDVTYVCNLQDSESEYQDKMRSLGVQLVTVPWREAPRRSVRFQVSAVRNLFSRFPLNVDKDFDSKLRRAVESLAGSGQFDLIVCDFVQMARNCLSINMPKLLFQHNVEAEVFERQAKQANGWWKRYLTLQAERMGKFEGAAGRDFDAVVAVSERDKLKFQQSYQWRHVQVIDTAVDTKYFAPSDVALGNEEQTVVFVGSMDWPPNVDGVLHFTRQIWPLVLAKNPSAKFCIVGRNPPRSIRALANGNDVIVTGTVSDTRPFLREARLSVVPLYAGGGTRLKIFESMAMKCPVISTPLGAEGLNLTDETHLLIRETDRAFADGVCQLLSDRARCHELADESHQLVQERYNSERIARQFEQCCFDAVKAWQANQLSPSTRKE